MVVMNLKANNLFDFNDFQMDFSYPKKIVGSSLEKEWLKDFPNFRYRRFNIIVGANSSGKTTLGQLLRNIFVLINKKEISLLLESIHDKDKEASFEIDFVIDGYLYRIKCILPVNADGENRVNIRLSIRSTKLVSDDNYESAKARIDKIKEEYFYYVDALEKGLAIGWKFTFPERNVALYNYEIEDENSYRLLLERILKIFDPSIAKVDKNKLMKHCFFISFNDGKSPIVVEKERLLSTVDRLSSGTKYAFNLADIIWGLKKDSYGFYYLDEQFSFVNSELELAFIAHLSGYSDNDDQIFITTHNTNVLKMDFPVHTFGFLKKTITDNGKNSIEYINASQYEKRNSASIENHYKNDWFNVLPDLSNIYTLGDIK